MSEFLERGQTGVQHLCVFTDDFNAACRDLEARGGTRLQGGHFADGSCLAYYDMGDPAPSILEVTHLKPEIHTLFATLKEAAANWDGKTRCFHSEHPPDTAPPERPQAPCEEKRMSNTERVMYHGTVRALPLQEHVPRNVNIIRG